VLIEACEESGSYDLPFYVDHLAERIGKPSLVVCLDSGCGNYDQLWCTTSLRGLAGGNLTVQVLERRRALGRRLRHRAVELPHAAPAAVAPRGRGHRPILLDGCYVEIPSSARAGAQRAKVLGTTSSTSSRSCRHDADGRDLTELVLNRTWRPRCRSPAPMACRAVDAGNVLRPFTAVKLSLRLPPTLDRKRAGELLKQRCERSAVRREVDVRRREGSTGWNAPALRRGWTGDRPAPQEFFGSRRCTWAKAARSRSWACSARNSRARSS
jgi:acetylornithine deacetylase/succinyl-diaminopimelate desuccinylase-like protein